MIGAGLLATVGTGQLYGMMSRQDIADEIEKRDRGIDHLETNHSLAPGDPGFMAVARAFEYEYEQEHDEEVEIARFEYNIPDTGYWDMLEERRGEPLEEEELIEAHKESNLLTKNPPTVNPITNSGNTASNPPMRFNRFVKNPSYDFHHRREALYLNSAIAVLVSGFVFQIAAYLIKIICL